ncbi:SDR family oxidoreductase [Acaricomes phytoseiuli]|uniref:SDR family oxidoreductase n=1 Tax=Acaricomes phytoseiuli TaxID=291968 RepID=UPI000366ABAA|nr:SDR family oxidoreductase [Acaricomes phytoseiuli]MCW1249618.1 SDR family oxidoreductase [Acaricomes phytoseiuli]
MPYDVPSQSGRRIIVTGANSGTGKETATRLAAAGASLILGVRNLEKGEAAKQDILRQSPGAEIEVRRIDLSDLASIREFANGILDDGKPLHVLINNAGVMTPPTRETTKDGFELQFGSNFLGPFLLTTLLLPRLLEADNPRIATMSSSAANIGSINHDDLQAEQNYQPVAAYNQSKLADMLLTTHLAEIAERKGWPLLSTGAHPGFTRTNLQTSGPNMGTERSRQAWFLNIVPSMEVSQGAEPILRAATDSTAKQGAYYGPRWFLIGEARPARIPRSARKADAQLLWDAAAELTGAPDISKL